MPINHSVDVCCTSHPLPKMATSEVSFDHSATSAAHHICCLRLPTSVMSRCFNGKKSAAHHTRCLRLPTSVMFLDLLANICCTPHLLPQAAHISDVSMLQ
eukprot:1157444-Pelagomonas_calceolata.AAC.4